MPKSKQPKDPHAPKRSHSSYLLFSNERRKILSSENPSKRITEISQLISAEWKSLTDSQKEPYITKAAELKKEYQKKLEEYKQTDHYKKFQKKLEEWKRIQKETKRGKKKQNNNNNDSDDNVKSDDSMDGTHASKKKTKRSTKKNKAPKKPKQPSNMPKRPQTSYFLFSNERRPQLKEQYPEKKLLNWLN